MGKLGLEPPAQTQKLKMTSTHMASVIQKRGQEGAEGFVKIA
jgi:hypothetical protein